MHRQSIGINIGQTHGGIVQESTSQRFLVLRAAIMTSYLGRPLHEYVALTVQVFTSLRLVLGPEILSNLT